jgi:hypothetical protein
MTKVNEAVAVFIRAPEKTFTRSISIYPAGLQKIFRKNPRKTLAKISDFFARLFRTDLSAPARPGL